MRDKAAVNRLLTTLWCYAVDVLYCKALKHTSSPAFLDSLVGKVYFYDTCTLSCLSLDESKMKTSECIILRRQGDNSISARSPSISG